MNPIIFNQLYRHHKKLPLHFEFLNSDDDLKGLFEIDSQLSDERVTKYKLLYNGIGNTGCYTVILPNNNLLRIKMEYSNAMGNSHYARYWLPYLYLAESLNLITPGKSEIIDVTSGSAGIALAIASKALQYKCTLIVPQLLPTNRIQPMIDYGANLIITDGYIDSCISELQRLINSNQYFPTNHSEEKSELIINIFRRIIIEYLNSFDCPDYAIAGLGNGTSTYSVFSEIKKRHCQTKCISYHPDLKREQLVFGLYGPNVKLRHVYLADELTDEKYFTNDISFSEIDEYFKDDTEILNLGPSSKYGLVIAYELAKKVNTKTFLTIGYDKNDRY